MKKKHKLHLNRVVLLQITISIRPTWHYLQIKPRKREPVLQENVPPPFQALRHPVVPPILCNHCTNVKTIKNHRKILHQPLVCRHIILEVLRVRDRSKSRGERVATWSPRTVLPRVWGEFREGRPTSANTVATCARPSSTREWPSKLNNKYRINTYNGSDSFVKMFGT